MSMSDHRIRIIAVIVYFYFKAVFCHSQPIESDGAKGNPSVTYYLYKKPYPGKKVELFTGDVNGLRQSGYNASLKTLIVTHGWTSTIDSPSVASIGNASLKHLNVNFIAVDWSNYSLSPNYVEALSKVQFTGEILSYFVDFLIHQGASPKHIHVVGHSLGAHVAGFAGKRLKKLGHILDRITGLDAALPLVSIEPTMRLSKDDALFVDCIHTDGSVAGFTLPLGVADYYPNGGVPIQPGCKTEHPNVCSHARAPAFFAESVNPKHHFNAQKCKMVLEGVPLGCEETVTAEMGYYTSSRYQGSFYLKTNAESPYALNITS